MKRYFVRRAPKASLYVDDDPRWPEPTFEPHMNVPEHIATNTGLLDANGDTIMRAPNPMGFIWKED